MQALSTVHTESWQQYYSQFLYQKKRDCRQN